MVKHLLPSPMECACTVGDEEEKTSEAVVKSGGETEDDVGGKDRKQRVMSRRFVR